MGQITSTVSLIDQYGIEVEVPVTVYYREEEDVQIDGIWVLKDQLDLCELTELDPRVYLRLEEECRDDRRNAEEMLRESLEESR